MVDQLFNDAISKQALDSSWAVFKVQLTPHSNFWKHVILKQFLSVTKLWCNKQHILTSTEEKAAVVYEFLKKPTCYQCASTHNKKKLGKENKQHLVVFNTYPGAVYNFSFQIYILVHNKLISEHLLQIKLLRMAFLSALTIAQSQS